MHEWNDTTAAYATDEPYNRLFEQQVERTPDAIAVVCGSRQLTYAELNERANSLARSLIEQGINCRVGGRRLHASRDQSADDHPCSIEGGRRISAARPWLSGAKKSRDCGASGTRLVIASRECLTKFNEICNSPEELTAPAVLVVEDALEQQRETQNLPLRALPDNLAYIIYTSGSTGVPKGAMIHHRGMTNHMWGFIEEPR